MPPALRRSQRRKRPPPQRDLVEPSTPPTDHTKKQKTARSASTAPQNPEPPKPRLYRSCQQTLFLGRDFDTIFWNPPTMPQAYYEEGTRCLDKFNNDIHSYFTSKPAAKLAANSKLNVYRHVGHIVLHKFQQQDGLPLRHQWFPAIRKSKEQFINMRRPLEACWFDNDALARPLDSLSSEQFEPWKAPFIVLVAERTDIIRACDVERYPEDFDLPVQVYISRLLFELIACRDIRILFSALKPSVPFTPLPQPPQHPAVFQRSPHVSRTGGCFASLLRDAESTGYAGLTQAQRTKIENALTVKLYPYQEQTVRWMLDKENNQLTLNEQLWEEHFFTDTPYAKGGSFFYFPMSGEVRLARPPAVRGGMVCEEMGLGKTVEALALIACQKTRRRPQEVEIWCEDSPDDVDVDGNRIKLTRLHSQNIEHQRNKTTGFHHDDEVLTEDVSEIEFPCSVRVRRWPAATTLVVCPESLLGQWRQEVIKRTPSLSVFAWPPPKEQGRDGGTDIATGKDAKDIVLATYEMVRRDPRLSKICWRRVILDESQVTRRSAALVAKDVFNLRCATRFLMTGTPLVTSINDLKGQLACLKVWPFSLDQDGFWESFISYPFSLGCEVPQLRQLLSQMMIRHSKAQNLNLSLPSRTYQTLRVDLTGSHRACYYYVLGSCLNEIEAQNRFYVDTRRIRPLLRLLVAICLSPALLDPNVLDLARRLTWSRCNSTLKSTKLKLEKCTPEDAIKFVARSNDASNSMIHQSNRSYAADTMNRETDPELKKYLEMALAELRDHVIKASLAEPARAKRWGRDRLASIAAGGVHRVYTDTVMELRETAIRLNLGEKDEVARWSRAKAKARLLNYYDMEKGIKICRTVHESGYIALSKLIEKNENPSCPVCLMDCDGRLSITKCGHLYCYDCILILLGQSHAHSRCAICRRDLTPQQVVEVLRPKNIEAEAKAKAETQVLMDSVNQFLASGHSGAGSSSDTTGRSLEVNLEVVERDELSVSRPTAREAWAAYEDIGAAPPEFRSIGRSERCPSLEPEILQHIAAGQSVGYTAPKMLALLQLIRRSSDDTKFCVVAGNVENLRLIHKFLLNHDIKSVGVGESPSAPGESRSMTSAAEQFSTDPFVRVFLLNPTNAAGLTLTAASVVVFMETLVRVADEIQAAARVHRIGQTKDVQIVRIIARGTIEENIVAQRGEIRSAAEEARALATVTNQEASDRLIMQLFLSEFDDSASQDSGEPSDSDESDDEYDSSFE